MGACGVRAPDVGRSGNDAKAVTGQSHLYRAFGAMGPPRRVRRAQPSPPGTSGGSSRLAQLGFGARRPGAGARAHRQGADARASRGPPGRAAYGSGAGRTRTAEQWGIGSCPSSSSSCWSFCSPGAWWASSSPCRGAAAAPAAVPGGAATRRPVPPVPQSAGGRVTPAAGTAEVPTAAARPAAVRRRAVEAVAVAVAVVAVAVAAPDRPVTRPKFDFRMPFATPFPRRVLGS